MDEAKRDLLKQKLDHIKEDYDAALSTCLHDGDRVSHIRTWTVTVIAAYLGYMLKSDDLSTVRLLPLFGAIVLFWIMEALTKASGILSGYTLGRVDEVFAVTDPEKFWSAVEEYGFWRLQDKPFASKRPEEKKWRLRYKRGRIRRFCKGLFNEQTFVFYILPLVVLLALGIGRLYQSANTQRAPDMSTISLNLSDIRPQTPTPTESSILTPAPPTKRPLAGP